MTTRNVLTKMKKNWKIVFPKFEHKIRSLWPQGICSWLSGRSAIFIGVSFPNKFAKHIVGPNESTFPNYNRQKLENLWRFQNWPNQKNAKNLFIFWFTKFFSKWWKIGKLVKIYKPKHLRFLDRPILKPS